MSNSSKSTQLGNLADIIMGQSPDSNRHNTEGYGLPFLQGCAEFGKQFPLTDIYCFPALRISRPDSILISVRAPVGKINWSEQSYCIGRGLASIKAKPRLADTHFLSYAINNNLSFLHCRSQGSTFLAICANDLKIFPVPAISYGEQKRISDILRKVDHTIAATESLINKYQKIKAGLMHDLFTRGIGVDGKLRPPREEAPELYQETAIGWIPKEWAIFQISKLAAPSKGSTVIGPFGSDLVIADFKSEGTPVIFVRDVKEDRFNWISNVFISTSKTQLLFSHRVCKGDLLATKMGLPPCVSCVYPDDIPMGVITADMIRMTVDRSKVHPNWLSTAINHDRVKRQVAAITAGVTRPKVTLRDFRRLKIATPRVQEQLAINSLLDRQRRLISSEEKTRIKLQKQKNGLMRDLLTGKVSVNTDLNEVGCD